jgi:transglutaminase-like putative cysteine protease
VSGNIPSAWASAATPRDVEIVLESGPQSKSYLMPVRADGSFSGAVASPFPGPADIGFGPASFGLDAQASSPGPFFAVGVYIPQTAALPDDLQASAAIDYNDAALSPALKTAATLWANAPDPKSGLEAISKWTSTTLHYDDQRLNTASATWATAGEVYQAGTGICQDYADLLVGLYRGIGIPAEVVGGLVTDAWTDGTSVQAGSTHAWVSVDLGSSNFIMDPTWDGSGSAQDDFLTDAYVTQTAWYTATHFLSHENASDPVN